MNDDHGKAKTIFLRAVEIAAVDERQAYLAAACGGDAALRSEVEDLLRHQERLGSFLEAAPGGPATAAELTQEAPGTVIGPYKLLQQIGEGGMGTVYMAEQTQPVQRRVALKVIKPGMDSRQVIARFEAERQALAMMDHVNIARVFDGGTTTGEPGGVSPGRPYFVMELVHGVPITKYCDDNHLTPRERLELFVPVCQAIQHAHQKGIIHCDIKPSNVMVTLYDGKPVPKVIDFGVAKATEQKLTERTLFTQYGTMVGTLEYMSPEQAEMSALGIDTRSDIYSLGVLLYELLTGSTPLSHKRMKEAAFAEILRMIKEEEPPRPSTRLSDSGEALASISANRHTEPAKLTKLVRGELDWIVMKTLEKDRNRRYETANGFAADVQRYLNDEQVQACPPSAWYKFRKFARRNKAALVMASVIGVAILLAVGSLGWVVRDRAALRVRTAGEVKQFLQRAESLYADNKLPEAVAEVQKARGVLEAGSGDEDLGRRVRQWLTDLDTAAKLEEFRLESYDLEDRDRGYADHARVFRDYGIDVEALSVEEAAARVAGSQIKLDLAIGLLGWADRLRFDPRPQDPARWQRLYAISRTADPDPWRLRLLGAAEAKNVQTLRELANGADPGRLRTRTLAYLGYALRTAGDVEAAVAFLRKAQRQHPGDFSINSTLAFRLSELKPPPLDELITFRRVALAVRPQSAWAHYVLGIALGKKDRIDEAIIEYRDAIRLRPGYVYAHYNLGNALYGQKKLDEAIACYKKAIELDPKYAIAHNNLGAALIVQKKLDEAMAAYKKAIEIDPKSANAYVGVGNALYDQKKLDEAIVCFKKAIEIAPQFVNARIGLGAALTDQEKLDEAVACFKKAIEIHPNYALAHYSLGVALKKQEKVDAAIAEYRKAIALDPRFALAHNNLGGALFAQKKWDEAIACYRTAINIDPKDALAHNNLGLALHAQNKWDEADASYRAAIKADPNYAEAHYNLGVTLYAQKKLDDAIACYKRTIALAPNYTKAYGNLGRCHLDQKKFDDAVTYYRKAIALDPKTPWRHNNLGSALERQNKLDAAIAEFRTAIALDPKDAIFHFNLGIALKKQNKLEEAVAEYRTAIALDPKDPDAPYELGLALFDQNKPEDAIVWCKKAIAIDPKHAKAHNVIGIALMRQNKLDEAVAEYRTAIALDAKDAQPHYNLGNVLRDQNKLDEAVAEYREAIRLNSDYAKAHNDLGVVLQAQGKVDDAIVAFRAAIHHKSDDALARCNLGIVLMRKGKVDEAITAFKKATELAPKYVGAHINLGIALRTQSKSGEAIAAFKRAVEIKPKLAEAHNWLAWELTVCSELELRDPKQALVSARLAVQLAPKNGMYWQGLGYAEYRSGNWKAAVLAFAKVKELGSAGDSLEWFPLAMAYWQLDDKDAARKNYDQAVQWMAKNKPTDPFLRGLQSEAAELMGIELKKE